MPLADPSFEWTSALIAFVAIAFGALFVTWVVTDVLGVRRTPYVAILSALVAGLSAAYLLWSETSPRALVVDGWAAGVAAGIVAGVIVLPLVRKLPAYEHPHGVALGETLAWEAVVYGVAEALLLATLPAIALWHGAADLGWTGTTWTNLGAGAVAVLGSLLVILVHHLGYAEFRSARARTKLVGALVTCGLQAVAFLVTGNVLAPIVAHVVLHTELVFRGVEMPPSNEGTERTELRTAA